MVLTARLLWIHGFAGAAVWLSSYWAGLEYVVALLYLLVLGSEARAMRDREAGERFLISLAWQLPAFFMALILLTGWNPMQPYDYAIFILGFWLTPVLPWLALLPPSGLAYPSYYYGLIISPLLLSLWIWVFSSKINPLAAYKHRIFGSAKDCVD
ncbi:MAG: hypothetical protein ACOX0F_06620 [Syntrophomonadaceae bacterium]|jgi:hypothetical protein